MYKLSETSLAKLVGLHPDLVRLIKRAIEITTIDFTVLEGKRTLARQQHLYSIGATRTMNSRHLTGHAVDLGAWVSGKVAWDWPLYYKIADAMKDASDELNLTIEWGGDWKTFKDGPHFQLPWLTYPA